MHPIIRPLLVLVSLPSIALGQVTVDLHALDSLPAARPGTERPATQVPRPARPAPTQAGLPTPPPVPAPVGEQAAPTASIALPAAQLPAAQLPSGPPPSAAPVASASAPAAAVAQSNLRILFTGAQTELSADNAAAIKELAAGQQGNDSATYNVVAYATGASDDASVARRLSLSRALAVRNALIAGGITSSRVYVRALGSQSAGGPPDRADLTVLGAGGANAVR